MPSNNFRIIVFSHSYYCADCWESLDPKPKGCPLCLTPIRKGIHLFKDSGESNICPMRLEKPLDAYLIP